jgi:hypothetical protein
MQPNACTVSKFKNDMAGKVAHQENPSNSQRDERLPPEILEIIKPALQVGALSGMSNAHDSCFILWHMLQPPDPLSFT